MIATAQIATLAGLSGTAELPATNGTIALLNLDAQIDGLESDVGVERWTVEGRIGFIELITLRGLILGRVADYERAGEVAEQLARDATTEGAAFFARARTRAVFHRFADALADIDIAEQLSLDADAANSERAAIFQAIGRYDEALSILEDAARRRTNFENIAALAGLAAERGEIEAAQLLYSQSLSHYRGVSPFPLALLDFQLGLMWMNGGQLDHARASFAAARLLVPAYAPAEGHLAEVEAELGDVEAAIARLYPLASVSDDPDFAAQLARILGDAGHAEESRDWCEVAAARYDELISHHPEAFADHAAEFWLAAGADPTKALPLARLNFELRKTPRAYDLLSQAVSAHEAMGATSYSALSQAGDRPGRRCEGKVN